MKIHEIQAHHPVLKLLKCNRLVRSMKGPDEILKHNASLENRFGGAPSPVVFPKSAPTTIDIPKSSYNLVAIGLPAPSLGYDKRIKRRGEKKREKQRKNQGVGIIGCQARITRRTRGKGAGW